MNYVNVILSSPLLSSPLLSSPPHLSSPPLLTLPNAHVKHVLQTRLVVAVHAVVSYFTPTTHNVHVVQTVSVFAVCEQPDDRYVPGSNNDTNRNNYK